MVTGSIQISVQGAEFELCCCLISVAQLLPHLNLHIWREQTCGHIECNLLVLLDHELHPDYAWEWKIPQSNIIFCRTATQSKFEIEILDFSNHHCIYILVQSIFICRRVQALNFKVNTQVIHSVDQSNCIKIHSNLKSPDQGPVAGMKEHGNLRFLALFFFWRVPTVPE